MKHLVKLLVLPLLLCCCACSSENGDPWNMDGQQEQVEKCMVRMSLTRADGENAFAEEGISEITIFVYHQLRTGTELLEARTVNTDNSTIQFELPLGETYQTFVVAGAASVTNNETLETVQLHLDPAQQQDVWLSGVVRFASDKSVSNLNLTMRRMVAQVSFAPLETTEELAARSEFDNLQLTFTNVATTWQVKTGLPMVEDLKLTTTAAEGYHSSFRTFATGENAGMSIDYLKGDMVVNSSPSLLEVGTKYETSHSYELLVPITNSDYVTKPFTD